ncbi:MAG: hypothetical protein HMLKMBBP_01749 [Planctomycetes bacterium]|nr:hypothetical protein [Planctomycetota bacterium]
MGILREFLLYLRQERKWWLVPLVTVLVLVGGLAALAVAFPGAAPFLYPLM